MTHLVVYQGGGYPGCIWEWNVFICTKRYKKITAFQNVFASGSAGIETIEAAQRLLAGDMHDVYVYDLRKKKQIADFSNAFIAQLVVGITSKVNKLLNKPVMFWECDHCHCEVSTGQLEGFSGQGGLAVAAEEKYCEDCYLTNSCAYCGEFDLELELEQDEEGRCQYCREQTPFELKLKQTTMKVTLLNCDGETVDLFEMPDSSTGQQIVNREIELGYDPGLYMFKIVPFACAHCQSLRTAPGKCPNCRKR